jgi:hypothetical protein
MMTRQQVHAHTPWRPAPSTWRLAASTYHAATGKANGKKPQIRWEFDRQRPGYGATHDRINERKKKKKEKKGKKRKKKRKKNIRTHIQDVLRNMP